jgi:hypothetical protein
MTKIGTGFRAARTSRSSVMPYTGFAEGTQKPIDTEVASMFRQIAIDEGDYYAAYRRRWTS